MKTQTDQDINTSPSSRKSHSARPRNRQRVLLFVLMLAFGWIIMSHITSVGVSQDRRDLSDRIRQRQEDLRLYEEQHTTLLRENEQLQQKKEGLIQELLISEGHDELFADLEKIRVLAGFTEVSGPGIILTLDDKPGFKIGDNEDSIVHDTDLKHALDLLLGADAAAFSINGNRFVNASDLKCIGLTIRCNQQRLSPPYVILALGDPARLSEAIEHDQTFNFRRMPGIDLVVKVQKSDRIVIPAYAESDNIDQYIDMLEVVNS